jgi:D-alanyl-lipoteichoic acid acyltransferase DltB (MBOAT superfamily)
VYIALRSKGYETASIIWLIGASFYFYGNWKITYLPILVTSICINFIVGRLLGTIDTGDSTKWRRYLLRAGILFNIGLLGYYKYADFFIDNVNLLFGRKIPSLRIILPLAISFFTFQQIAYLVDSYKGKVKRHSFLRYCLFVSFFPQLIAGPIVHHKEMMPQFDNSKRDAINWNCIYSGLFLIAIGLFKKVVVADTFGVFANAGYSSVDSLTFLSAWKTSLSYTIQLYFDFSGYTDMALGSARLINIHLPINFNSPYKAENIQDFWRRWHMTLSRFLRDYVYIPLGGNRKGTTQTYRNLFLTFLIGGIWHGAGWTFAVWGAIHGVAVVFHRIWHKTGIVIPHSAAWVLTFLFVNTTWVYFRAESLADANTVLAAMASPAAFDIGTIGTFTIQSLQPKIMWMILLSLFIVQDVFYRNSQEWTKVVRPSKRWSMINSLLFVTATLLIMSQNRFSEFLYFQF